MSLLRLAWRRVREHQAALLAVALSLLASLLAVSSLAVLTDRVAASAVVASVLSSPPEQRLVMARATTAPGAAVELDASVRQATQGPLVGRVTRASVAAPLGITGKPETARAQLADVSGIAERGSLTGGAWPSDSAARDGVIEVALPTSTLKALGWSIGSTQALTPLTSTGDQSLRIVVVGTFDPAPGEEALWKALGLVTGGVSQGDYPTFGPLLTASEALVRAPGRETATSWAWEPALSGLSADTVADAGAEVDRVVRSMASLPGLGGSAVRTDLPPLLARALSTSERVRLVTLTPTVLVLLLGAVALAVSAALMASVREEETRLLRARGGGHGQVALLALIEGMLLTLPAAVLAVLATILASGALTRRAALPVLSGGAVGVARVLLASGALAAGVVLALVLVVGAALRSGHLRSDRVLSTRVVGAAADVVLLALGALGVLQLQRYRDSGGLAVDPLTVLAPALVIGGLAALALRLVPLVARSASLLAQRSSGIRLAWASWQVARRVDRQRGSILLVILAVASGSLSLSYAATAQQARQDQAAFAAGAPLRVGPGSELVETGALAARYAALAGGRERVMPVYRGQGTVAESDQVEILAADLTRPVLRLRRDLLGGASWDDLRARLLGARPAALAGLPLPTGGRILEVEAVLIPGPGSYLLPPSSAAALLANGDGVRWSIPLDLPPVGEVLQGDGSVRLQAKGALTLTGVGVSEGTRLVAVTAVPLGTTVPATTARVRSVTVDGTPLPGAERVQGLPASSVFALGVPPSPVPSVPVVLTRAVARSGGLEVGSTLALPIQGRPVNAEVVGLIDSLPTASQPDLGVLVDLQTLNAALDVTTGSSQGPFDLAPQQWWLDPADLPAAERELAATPRLAVTRVSANDLLAQSTDSPVQAGMALVMTLLSLAAVLLAVLGFAATTSALGRARRREGAVLDALGLAPTRLRGALIAERAVVVLLSVAAGALVGTLTAYLTLPLLLAADGRPQVPPVVVVTPWTTYAVALGALGAVLVAVAALVLGVRREPPAEVLRGELAR